VVPLGSLVDLPQTKAELLGRFLDQIRGKLSARARKGEFTFLTDPEIAQGEQFCERAWDEVLEGQTRRDDENEHGGEDRIRV
jgi:hypothetical protein